MGNTCKICNDSNRVSIDRELCRGKSYQKIANDFNNSAQAIRRHWENGHVTHQMITAMQYKDVLEGQDLIGEIDGLVSRTKSLLSRAEEAAQSGKSSALQTAFKGIDSLRATYELLSKIAFSLHSARMQELELQQRKDGVREQEREQEFKDKIQRTLNDAELDLYHKLVEKIESEDSDIDVVRDYREPEEMEFMRGIERSTTSGRLSRLESKSPDSDPLFDNPLPEPEEEPEPEPTPRPTRSRAKKKEEPDPRPEAEKKMMKRTKPPVSRVRWEIDKQENPFQSPNPDKRYGPYD